MVRVLRKIAPYLWPHRRAFALALGGVLLIAGLELLKPWPLKVVLDDVLGGRHSDLFGGWSPESLLAGACAAIAILYLLLGTLNVFNNYVTIRIGQRMVRDLRADLYAQLQRRSLAFHHEREVGDLLYRVTADTYGIQTLAMNGLFPVISALLFLAGILAVMIQFDWLLTVLALAVCPALCGAIAFLNLRISAAANLARSREGRVYSVVERGISSIHVVQAFTREEEEHRRLMSATEASLTASLRLYTLETLYSGVVGLVIAVGTALLLWWGARDVLSGTLTVGELVVFISYLASLYAPVSNMVLTYGLVQKARVGVERVVEILEMQPDLPEGERAVPGGRARGELRLEGVSFGYAPGRPVLRDIDLRIGAGEKVALVGATGAGKSTLVGLFPRFYDPQKGRVLLDGVDLRELRLRDLRRQIALVLQPPLVFPATLRENIAYGRPDARLEEVIAAARAACIHDRIAALPEGYDTPVGEKGATLSEGERQRLTLARALLIEAPIVVLDEPTSSVDAETETAIFEALERILAGRTVLLISHRLSTVRRADRVLVLEDGRIVECGTPTELWAAGGSFRRIFASVTPEPARAAAGSGPCDT